MRGFFVWLALSLAVFLFEPVSAGAGERVLLTSGEWPPYYSEHLPHGGIANQIGAESFALAGSPVEFEFLPWKRAQETALYGPAIGSAGWIKSSESERDFVLSDPLFESMRMFFYRKDGGFTWKTREDLKDLRVAVTLGSAKEIHLEGVQAKGKGRMDIARTYASGMKKLIHGRVDVYICNVAVGLYVLNKQIPKEDAALITYDDQPFMVETNHLIISRRVKEARALMDRFNQGLRQLKESGRYDELFEEFFLHSVMR